MFSGKEVIRRWTNLRDSYAKSKKATKDDKKSGSGAKKNKKYVFNDQMQFLNKLYHVRDTTDSLDENRGDNSEVLVEDDIDDPEPPAVDGRPANPFPMVRTPAAKRKHKKQDEFELKLLKALEPKRTCSKMSFLQSLMPHLEKYNENEFLQFQMGVLKVVEQINMQKQGLFMPIQNQTVLNHPNPQPHSQQISSYYFPNFNQPGTSTQVQPIAVQQNSYPQEQHSGQIGSYNAQMPFTSRPPRPSHSSPRVSRSPAQSQTAVRHRKVNEKVDGNKQVYSAQQLFHEINQDSQQTELSRSPSSPTPTLSANSPFSDNFDFGDDYQLTNL